MANTYSSSLRLIIQQDGTNQGTWGGYTNTNIASLIEQAITGVGAITVSGSSDHTLTVTNGASDEARNAVLNVTGTLTGAINVICPTAAKTYIVKNGTTGGYAITLKTSAGTGVSVPNGSTMLLYCDGANVVEGVNYSSGFTAANLTYTGTLTGGTGVVNIGSGQIYKDASGNVGIGTSSPSSYGKFAVSTTAANDGVNIVFSGSPGAAAVGTNFWLTNNTTVIKQAYINAQTDGGSVGAENAHISFGTIGSGTLSERMRIDSSGNVGIGTSSPLAKLAINSGGPSIEFGYSSSLSANFIQSINRTTAADVDMAYYLGVSSGAHKFYTQATERMRIDSSGNVGIGTSSPSTKLDVNGDVTQRNGSGAIIGTITNNAGWYEFGGSTNVNGTQMSHATAIRFLTNSTEAVRIDSSGNLLVGTTSGSYKITCNGQPGANGYTAWTNYSDQRLKENIVDFNGGLKEILNLKPKSFNYNELSGYDEETRARTVSGFIAQELQLVCPEMVGTTKIDGVEYLDTNTSNLNLLLVKAIQELKAELDDLKSQLGK